MPNECPSANGCPMEDRISNLERWQSTSERFHRDFYDYKCTQVENVTKIREQNKDIKENLNELLEWKRGQQAKPEKLIDKIAENILVLIVAAIVGYVIGQIGL